jgi:hypothetical protein
VIRRTGEDSNMKSIRLLFFALSTLLISAAFAADAYNGPRPPKPDLPYLVHADNLVPTEEVDATQESKKDDTTYGIRGAGSPARTPVPEPIFLIQSDKILPQRLELYRLEVKNGRREVTMSGKGRRRGGPKPLHLTVTKIEGNLYRVEAGQPLDDGQYSLSPSDSNKVFCFEVY